MRSTVLPLLSPMFASFLVQFSNAAIATVIAVQFAKRGGTETDVAVITVGFALGFVAGCFLAPGRIQQVGFIRGYASATSLCAVAILSMLLWDSTTAWTRCGF